MIRVLVAEDSATARALLVAIFSAEPDFQVIGEAVTGREAVAMALRLAPDLVTMDVQMPELDGLEATKQIMMYSPRPIVIVSATARVSEVELSLEATRAGALMVLPKPVGPDDPEFANDRRILIAMARAMAGVKVVRRHGASPRKQTEAPVFAARPANVAPVGKRLVAIAASTGGPAALRDLFAQIPHYFPAPIFVVQHIARGFTSGLAYWLSADTKLEIKVAELGEPTRNGTVYIAPEDRHLGCRLDESGVLRVVLDASAPMGAFRPSGSFLFQSCAEAVGTGLVAVILTGMGDDGVLGLRHAHAAGAHVIAQDEASSVIFGMPREACRAGVVNETLPLDAIARRLQEVVK